MGWKLQYNDSKNWDLKWNDCAITADFLAKMAPHQKINHFPGMNTLHRKNTLAKNLYRMMMIPNLMTFSLEPFYYHMTIFD